MVKPTCIFFFILSISCGVRGDIEIRSGNLFFDSLENTISTGNDSIPEILNRSIHRSAETGDSVNVSRAFYVLAKYYIIRTFEYPLAINYLFRALENFNNYKMAEEAAKCRLQIGL